MKRKPPTVRKPSRREFTKLATTSLVSAPFAFTAVSGQVKSKEQFIDEPTAPESHSGCDGAGPIVKRTDHIPPGTIEGGSFFLELKDELKGQPDGVSPRPKRYMAKKILEEKQYGNIARVDVITEYEHHFSYFYYLFPHLYGAQLLIWTQKLKSDGTWNPDDIPRPDVPPDLKSSHVLVKGGVSDVEQSLRQTVLVEIEKKLKHKETKRLPRPHKHSHEDNDREFRIGRWEIVDKDFKTSGFNGAVNMLVDGESPVNFSFMFSFYDPTKFP